ncbi:MAG: M24 family metallopeptidase, partial [Gemmatimonadales bacterium]
FDFHGVNPIMGRLLGPIGLSTRRLFVYLPRSGPPVAVVHRIELQPFRDFPGQVRPYAAWRELHEQLAGTIGGRTVAMECSPKNAVPYLDRVPHGVVELVESLGGRLVSSAPLVTRFAARWSAAELADHRTAAERLATIARAELAWAGQALARGEPVREAAVQQRVLEALGRAGLVTTDPPIVAFQVNAASPHYEPHEGADRALAAGDVMLLDLWAGVRRDTVFADQTWMAVAGRAPEGEVAKVWEAVRGARDAAVESLKRRWGKEPVTGASLDAVARRVISDAGYADAFVHRTGHSIDRDLHGSGPHLDSFETMDERELAEGVGFSVEPGVYLTGRFGMRSEINVVITERGPEVTPREPQGELWVV